MLKWLGEETRCGKLTKIAFFEEKKKNSYIRDAFSKTSP